MYKPLLVVVLAFGLASCAVEPVEPYTRPPPEYAGPPRTDTAFASSACSTPRTVT